MSKDGYGKVARVLRWSAVAGALAPDMPVRVLRWKDRELGAADTLAADWIADPDRAPCDGCVDTGGRFYFGWRHVSRGENGQPHLLLAMPVSAAPSGAAGDDGEWNGTLGELAATAGKDADSPSLQSHEQDELASFLAKPKKEKGSRKARKTKAAPSRPKRAESDDAAAKTRLRSGARAEPADPYRGTPEQLRVLDAHVVNLTEGRLSSGGTTSTTPADLERLLDSIADWRGSAAGGERRDVMLYAHGGLVSEDAALAHAWATRDWWLENGVYPVFFVWETGALDILEQLARTAVMGVRGGRLAEAVDRLVERIAREGRVVWQAMKANAALASAPGGDGGGRIFANRLARREALLDGIRLHALAHSAGSNFMAGLLPAIEQEAGWDGRDSRLRSVQLLAPALSLDAYDAALHGLAERRATRFVLYLLHRRYELGDNCLGLYNKSLLYLVSNALEERLGEPLLGLQESIDGPSDVAARLREAFADADSTLQLVVAPTRDGQTPGSAAQTHAGFDTDALTLESACAVMTGRNATAFPRSLTRSAHFAERPGALFDLLTQGRDHVAAAPALPAVEAGFAAAGLETKGSTEPSRARITGAQHLLSIGIDDFPGADRLEGCVRDSGDWVTAFAGMGFETQSMLDSYASGAAVRAGIAALVERASPGDRIAIHVSSHGTQLPDDDGDEGGGPGLGTNHDELLVCHDFERSEGLIRDDELYAMLMRLRPGVSLVTLFDTCHSGNATRAWLRGTPRQGHDMRTRFMRMPLQRQVAEASGSRGRSLFSHDDAKPLRYLAIAACQPNQQAREIDGRGLFSSRALPILSALGPGASARLFSRELERAFGSDLSIQQPMIEGPAGWQHGPLFAPAA